MWMGGFDVDVVRTCTRPRPRQKKKAVDVRDKQTRILSVCHLLVEPDSPGQPFSTEEAGSHKE